MNRIIKLPDKQSYFLFGPRLTGKSTLLKEHYARRKKLYIDLLNTNDFYRYYQEPVLLYNEVKAVSDEIDCVIIDEVQKVPALLDEVHKMLEEFDQIQFILCGSSARKLKRLHANLLGGRAATLHLGHFTFKELNESFHLNKVLEKGSLPLVYLSDSATSERILRSYVETYLEEEIRQEAIVRNLGAFLKFLPLAASESGSIINFSGLSQDLGISYKTVQEYFQILADTLLIFFLYPYQSSYRRQIIKHPKFYFFDTGVLRAIKKELTLTLSKPSPLFGLYFEHFIINEIRDYNDYFNRDYKLSFYRTHVGQEIDLIIEKPNKETIALEIKAKEKITRQDIKSLNSFLSICPKAKLFIVSMVPRKQQVENILILPWQDLWDSL